MMYSEALEFNYHKKIEVKEYYTIRDAKRIMNELKCKYEKAREIIIVTAVFYKKDFSVNLMSTLHLKANKK